MNRRARLALGLLGLFGRLPLGLLRALGSLLGEVALLLGIREARVARRNLEAAFPEWSPARRAALLRENLCQTGAALFELAWLWTRPPAEVLSKVREVRGLADFDVPRASGRPLMVLTPHIGAFELLSLWLGERTDIRVLYRPPKQRWLEDLLVTVRSRTGSVLLPAEPATVRTLLKHLRGGGTVGILPDQQPKAGEGGFAPFFGIPAFTMTLAPKLIASGGATAVLAWVERVRGGFVVHLQCLDPPPMDAAALNAAVESIARQAPAQYQWGYKRWSMRPPEESARFYD
ncbi:MAG: lipid A biosynthesis lauroyl acyltransferase [Xanthomonadales bacterium]|nr:lipid A biosynthesis lauroyl acyltransferase [Xanthomonadales bacterium]